MSLFPDRPESGMRRGLDRRFDRGGPPPDRDRSRPSPGRRYGGWERVDDRRPPGRDHRGGYRHDRYGRGGPPPPPRPPRKQSPLESCFTTIAVIIIVLAVVYMKSKGII